MITREMAGERMAHDMGPFGLNWLGHEMPPGRIVVRLFQANEALFLGATGDLETDTVTVLGYAWDAVESFGVITLSVDGDALIAAGGPSVLEIATDLNLLREESTPYYHGAIETATTCVDFGKDRISVYHKQSPRMGRDQRIEIGDHAERSASGTTDRSGGIVPGDDPTQQARGADRDDGTGTGG